MPSIFLNGYDTPCLGSKVYSEFITADGLLNEFKMMWALRESFPLHFIVFKQTACHLRHEANVEQVFTLPRPTRRRIAPRRCGALVDVGANVGCYKLAAAAAGF